MASLKFSFSCPTPLWYENSLFESSSLIIFLLFKIIFNFKYILPLFFPFKSSKSSPPLYPSNFKFFSQKTKKPWYNNKTKKRKNIIQNEI